MSRWWIGRKRWRAVRTRRWKRPSSICWMNCGAIRHSVSSRRRRPCSGHNQRQAARRSEERTERDGKRYKSFANPHTRTGLRCLHGDEKEGEREQNVDGQEQQALEPGGFAVLRDGVDYKGSARDRDQFERIVEDQIHRASHQI